MAKDIIFQTKKDGKSVVGEAKGIKLLRTNLQEGGTCDWVPEDETQLIPKVITQDGVYKVSDEIGDIYGYSEVTVQGIGDQIMGDLGTITIYKNGTYYAKNSYTPSDLGTSGDSENKTGPFYGYRTVVVNVSGSNTSGDSSDSGATSNSITGKDSDGTEVQYTTNKDGKFEKTPLATRIEVTVKPKFLVYRNGDKLNFNDIKVTAYAGDNIYKSKVCPTGILTQSNLTFPVIVANGGGGSTMPVPVKWKRPEDRKELTTSFDIVVNNV